MKYDLRQKLVGDADRGSKVPSILVLFKTVAASFGEDQRSGNAVFGTDSALVEVGPIAVLLMESRVVIPA
jgi:hypothetical protein